MFILWFVIWKFIEKYTSRNLKYDIIKFRNRSWKYTFKNSARRLLRHRKGHVQFTHTVVWKSGRDTNGFEGIFIFHSQCSRLIYYINDISIISLYYWHHQLSLYYWYIVSIIFLKTNGKTQRQKRCNRVPKSNNRVAESFLGDDKFRSRQ